MAGMAAGSTAWMHADGSFGQSGFLGSPSPKFAFVGVTGSSEGVHVYTMADGQWALRQIVPSAAPVCMALDSRRQALLIANGVYEFQGLPTGTVEAYKWNDKTGHLQLLGRQALSLSATMPKHLAVSPDGKSLVVAVHGGGAYNLLPVFPDGSLGRVRSILKEIGSGPVAGYQDAAHPQAVLFDHSGKRVIASDLGSDRISLISIEDGLEVLTRYEMPAGSGPSQIVQHPNGHFFYVSHALDGSLSVLCVDPDSGNLTGLRSLTRGQFRSALALDGSGDFLYAAGQGGLSIFRVNSRTGELKHIHSRQMPDGVRQIVPLPDTEELLAVVDSGILKMRLDAASGHLSKPILVAPAKGAQCVAVV
jgi:6-phosphogluconolactonase (cycloisomerase 2 family)